MPRIGIMAYGSLIDDPGDELGPLVTECIADIQTPFSVEFARTSSTRDGAPTLVPVEQGGLPVEATILVLRDDVPLDHARNKLWRRETGHDGDYKRPARPTVNTVLVCEISDVAGIDHVLYTRIGANIPSLCGETLAELAIASAKADAGSHKRDGISYLLNAKRNGISTPLMGRYEAAILEKTGASSLEDAWTLCQTDGA